MRPKVSVPGLSPEVKGGEGNGVLGPKPDLGRGVRRRRGWRQEPLPTARCFTCKIGILMLRVLRDPGERDID